MPITIFVFEKKWLLYCIVSIWFLGTKITLKACVDGAVTIQNWPKYCSVKWRPTVVASDTPNQWGKRNQNWQDDATRSYFYNNNWNSGYDGNNHGGKQSGYGGQQNTYVNTANASFSNKNAGYQSNQGGQSVYVHLGVQRSPQVEEEETNPTFKSLFCFVSIFMFLLMVITAGTEKQKTVRRGCGRMRLPS
jgi:hypothetical protein